jgi:hypothetical protein
MTESAQDQTPSAPEGDQAPPGTGTPPEPETPPSEDHSPAGREPETFPAAYVKQLREEAAAHRVKAQRADDLSARLLTSVVQNVTGDLLRSASDLPEADYLTEEGLPDEAKIRAAAEQLISERPWLARVRGDVGQGPRVEPQNVSLGSILREAAR